MERFPFVEILIFILFVVPLLSSTMAAIYLYCKSIYSGREALSMAVIFFMLAFWLPIVGEYFLYMVVKDEKDNYKKAVLWSDEKDMKK